MVESGRRAIELNELTWWSHWARLSWFGRNAHILLSGEFDEPFFNRAGLLACAGIEGALDALEARFGKEGVDPTVLLYDSCSRGIKHLTNSGYRLVDRMIVMSLRRPRFRMNESLTVTPVKPGGHEQWSRAYLQSFYGGTNLLPSVNRAIENLAAGRDVTLLEGLIGDTVAGVLAVQRTKNLAGVYCVGTVPRFRRMGVSGTLITRAHEIASREKRRLILQTLESDDVEDFYLEGGFRRLYTKDMLSRKLKT